MSLTLSPKDLAAAIGSSESSLKRWIDGGKVRASRTIGGHRRVPLPEAIRFIREFKLAVVRPEIIGLKDLSAVAGELPALDSASERLCLALKEGRASEVRGLIMSLYLTGESVAAICDGPIREALSEIGALWEHGPRGIFLEHRSTGVCIQALQQLELSFDIPADAPVALGGAVGGDPYLLPSLCVATVLAEEGFRAINLGPDCPAAAILEGVATHSPLMCWLTNSSVTDRGRQRDEIVELANELGKRGIALALGGRRLAASGLDTIEGVFVGSTMQDLVSFTRGLRMARASGEPANTVETPP